jgi:hypothetical protein
MPALRMGYKKRDKNVMRKCEYTGYAQKNGAVSIVKTIETAPFFCVYSVLGIAVCMGEI